MDRFENVTIIKHANSYFDGNVTSRTVLFADGTRKTLGIMMPGEYTFGTADKEIMEILAGELDVLLPGGDGWEHFSGGQQFAVPANASFQLRVQQLTDYCCAYIKE